MKIIKDESAWAVITERPSSRMCSIPGKADCCPFPATEIKMGDYTLETPTGKDRAYCGSLVEPVLQGNETAGT